jgi:hypothetical protein
MATAAAIRQRVRNYLYGVFPTEAPFVSRITASYTNVATSVTVFEDDYWEVNDILENPATEEQMIVLAKPGANVLTVSRGWNNTTNLASVGTTDNVYKNPRFTVDQIDVAIDQVIASLEQWGIHIHGQGAIVRVDPKEFYELTETDILEDIGVYKVYEVDDNYEFPRALPFRYQHSLGIGPVEYTTTGHGVHVLDWGNRNNGESVFFLYAKKIDNVTDLLTRQEELVVVGAAGLLLGATVIPATHDPGARTDRTVPPGQTTRDVRYLQGRFFTEARLEEGKLAVERKKSVHETPRYARARRWVS